MLDPATAAEAARFCLEVLSGDATFVARTTPSFLVVPYVLDALAGLLDAADDALHRHLAPVLAGLPPVTDQLEARGWTRVAAGLRATVLVTPDDRAALRQSAASQPNRRLSAAILERLADGDAQARELLLTRIADGDNDALAALGDVRRLSAQVAGRLMAQDAELLGVIIAEAHSGVHALRARDPAARLALLGSHFPEVAPWDALLRYLGDARVPGDRKRKACLALAQHADQLPEPARSALRELIPRRAPSSSPLGLFGSPLGLFGSPLGGAAMVLAAAVGVLDDQDLASGVAGLLTGSRQARRDAAALIGRLGHLGFTGALVALLSDPYPDVRAEAASALAIRVANPDSGFDPLAIAGLQRALADPGARTPLAIATAVPTVGTPSDQAAELLVPLLGHPSALVRKAAAQTVHG